MQAATASKTPCVNPAPSVLSSTSKKEVASVLKTPSVNLVLIAKKISTGPEDVKAGSILRVARAQCAPTTNT